MRGSKTITDSAASVLFLLGPITNVKVYGVRGRCPPTLQYGQARRGAHNDGESLPPDVDRS